VRRSEADEFDLVAVGRALIANPAWVRLVQEQRLADIRAYDSGMLEALV